VELQDGQKEKQGIKNARRSRNPSAGLSGEEEVMIGHPYDPWGG